MSAVRMTVGCGPKGEAEAVTVVAPTTPMARVAAIRLLEMFIVLFLSVGGRGTG